MTSRQNPPHLTPSLLVVLGSTRNDHWRQAYPIDVCPQSICRSSSPRIARCATSTRPPILRIICTCSPSRLFPISYPTTHNQSCDQLEQFQIQISQAFLTDMPSKQSGIVSKQTSSTRSYSDMPCGKIYNHHIRYLPEERPETEAPGRSNACRIRDLRCDGTLCEDRRFARAPSRKRHSTRRRWREVIG